MSGIIRVKELSKLMDSIEELDREVGLNRETMKDIRNCISSEIFKIGDALANEDEQPTNS